MSCQLVGRQRIATMTVHTAQLHAAAHVRIMSIHVAANTSHALCIRLLLRLTGQIHIRQMRGHREGD